MCIYNGISYHFSVVLVAVKHFRSGLVLSGQHAADPVLALACTLACSLNR